jgi:hypothetical protein
MGCPALRHDVSKVSGSLAGHSGAALRSRKRSDTTSAEQLVSASRPLEVGSLEPVQPWLAAMEKEVLLGSPLQDRPRYV